MCWIDGFLADSEVVNHSSFSSKRQSGVVGSAPQVATPLELERRHRSADPQKSVCFSVVVSVNDVTFTFGFVRHRVTLEILRRRTHRQVSQGAAEDINGDGQSQPFLPPADPVAGVDWDLNYLHPEENVTSG
jgi:hypothetical protein